MPEVRVHDPFFYEVFCQPVHFAAFGRAALDRFSRLVVWDEAEAVPTSSTDETLVRSTADLLWKVPLVPRFRSRPNGPKHLYFLLEHKSHPDPETVFHVYLRLVRLWTQPPRKLPKRLVVPVVITNTPRPWDVQTSAVKAFRAQGELTELVPELRVVHVPLDEALEERIETDWDLKAAVRAMWMVGRGEVGLRIRRALEYAARGSWAKGDGRFVQALLRYVTSGKMGMSVEALRRLVEQVLTRRGAREMSTYQEYWRELGVEKGYRLGITEGLQRGRQEGLQRGRQEGLQRGRQEGLQRGRQEGLQRGRQEGLRESVLLVLQRRFGQVPSHIVEKLEQTEDLDALQEALVTASTTATIQDFLDSLGWNGSPG